MPLSPHELIEVRVQHHLVNPLHQTPPLYAIPIGFDVLCVDPCCWVHKVEGVVHCLVVVDRLQLLDPVVGCPQVPGLTWRLMMGRRVCAVWSGTMHMTPTERYRRTQTP